MRQWIVMGLLFCSMSSVSQAEEKEHSFIIHRDPVLGEMVEVPKGDFILEFPKISYHIKMPYSFLIQRYEVAVEDYFKFLWKVKKAQQYLVPSRFPDGEFSLSEVVFEELWPAYLETWHESDHSKQLPVVGVTSEQAELYCADTDIGRARLPMRNEWEKAAVRKADRGAGPNGEDVLRVESFQQYRPEVVSDPDEFLLKRHIDVYKDLLYPVGSHSDDESAYGAMDMAGSVGEWVVRWTDVVDNRWAKGGNDPWRRWINDNRAVRFVRLKEGFGFKDVPDKSIENLRAAFWIGFRCVKRLDYPSAF